MLADTCGPFLRDPLQGMDFNFVACTEFQLRVGNRRCAVAKSLKSSYGLEFSLAREGDASKLDVGRAWSPTGLTFLCRLFERANQILARDHSH